MEDTGFSASQKISDWMQVTFRKNGPLGEENPEGVAVEGSLLLGNCQGREHPHLPQLKIQTKRSHLLEKMQHKLLMWTSHSLAQHLLQQRVRAGEDGEKGGGYPKYKAQSRRKEG